MKAICAFMLSGLALSLLGVPFVFVHAFCEGAEWAKTAAIAFQYLGIAVFMLSLIPYAIKLNKQEKTKKGIDE